ncbi:hypothetical protein E2C01_050083 [Portunus trituberculatus]|uniref:Uncharacterized protein n=1 Tax=Portunus trituberculatus TaxID=210409 RepID=A0A5B7G7B7_PORTR|nr:hypothetical protein [Portunus trituberculatus]
MGVAGSVSLGASVGTGGIMHARRGGGMPLGTASPLPSSKCFLHINPHRRGMEANHSACVGALVAGVRRDSGEAPHNRIMRSDQPEGRHPRPITKCI